MKNKELKSDKKRLILIGIGTVLVILTLFLYATMTINKGEELFGWTIIFLGLVALAVTIILFKKRQNELNKGMPLQDERSKKVLALAFGKAFIISIWLLLVLSWLSDAGMIEFRDVSQAYGIGILSMAIVFGICWLWYNRKDNIDDCWC